MKLPLEYLLGAIVCSVIMLILALGFGEAFDKECEFQDKVYKVSFYDNQYLRYDGPIDGHDIYQELHKKGELIS